MDNHQVRIKINGQEEKTYSNRKKKRKEKKVNISDKIILENSNRTDEDLPLIIVDEMAAAAEKKEEEEFEWVLPKEPEKKESNESPKNPSYIEDVRNLKQEKGIKPPPSPFGKKKKLGAPSFSKQLMLSIGMAIGIGTCLGFLILAIMNMSNNPLNPDPPAVNTVTGSTDNDTNKNGNSIGDSSFTLPAQTVAVVQGGVFSSKDGANDVTQQLKGEGFSAVLVGADPTIVLIAVGQSIDNMKEIGGFTQEKGFEHIAKELALPEKTFDSLTEQDAALLQEGQDLYKELIAASALLLTGGALEGDSMAKLEENYNQVVKINDENLTDGPKQWRKFLIDAYNGIQEYQGNKNTPQLWDVQQNLLEATVYLY